MLWFYIFLENYIFLVKFELSQNWCHQPYVICANLFLLGEKIHEHEVFLYLCLCIIHLCLHYLDSMKCWGFFLACLVYADWQVLGNIHLTYSSIFNLCRPLFVNTDLKLVQVRIETWYYYINIFQVLDIWSVICVCVTISDRLRSFNHDAFSLNIPINWMCVWPSHWMYKYASSYSNLNFTYVGTPLF